MRTLHLSATVIVSVSTRHLQVAGHVFARQALHIHQLQDRLRHGVLDTLRSDGASSALTRHCCVANYWRALSEHISHRWDLAVASSRPGNIVSDVIVGSMHAPGG